MTGRPLTSIEICAGAGGQALGLEQAGYEHKLLVEYWEPACQILEANEPGWRIERNDVRAVDFTEFSNDDIDLVAGGVPCTPASKAGKQLGASDSRNLWPDALRMVEEVRPRAAMFENVRGLMDDKFAGWRQETIDRLESLGYRDPVWKLIYAADFGVPQLRPRSILVAFRDAEDRDRFQWPEPITPPGSRVTVGAALEDLVRAKGWEHAEHWAKTVATTIAPTLVGGSEKHGGADLGPTRARAQWLRLGVDGLGLANHGDAPAPGWPKDKPFKLTVRMAARIQGFPDTWKIDEVLRKTNAYKTMGNAFPPPVARAVGMAIRDALEPSWARNQHRLDAEDAA
ncbi:DNA (cytosine-5-)-methyltransferase [Terrabacter sp. NPDC080008]|uniref:DNA cytosine methyltransferase n=1 Tax=Terrabacter sp. NPDC080008 TaxID=3155176 RepID=UPI00344C1C8C